MSWILWRKESYWHGDGDGSWNSNQIASWKYVDAFENRDECEKKAAELTFIETSEDMTHEYESEAICRPAGHNPEWE